MARGGGGRAAVAGGTGAGEAGGDAGDGRLGRGGRGVHADAVSGGGIGGDVRLVAATIGGGRGFAGCGLRGGGDGEHAVGDDALAVAGDDHGLRDLAGLLADAAADAGVRGVHARGAPAASRVHLHRAAAPQRADRAAGGHGVGSRRGANGRGPDAGAGAAGARDGDAAGNRRPVPDRRQ